MNRQEQYDFVRELIGNTEAAILGRLEHVPENWSGHELLVYVAEVFTQVAAVSTIRKLPRHRRAREYRNTILENGL